MSDLLSGPCWPGVALTLMLSGSDGDGDIWPLAAAGEADTTPRPSADEFIAQALYER